VPFRKLLLLGALVITAHNLEEAAFLPAWLEPRLPALQREWGLGAVPAVPRPRLYAALVVVTVVPAALLAWAAGGGPRLPALAVIAVFFWNALVPHLASAILLRAYTPGVATAVLINLPYAVHVFRRARREGVAGGARLAAVLGGAALVYGLLMGLWAVAALSGRSWSSC
jgi:hypothetical protein